MTIGDAISSARGLNTKTVKLVGFTIALALLAAAIYFATRDRDALSAALDNIRTAPPLWIAALAAATALGPPLTALSLWILTTRYGRVGFGEMTALVSAAWLLNYLPLRPGMFGRIAYHKAVNNIAIIDSGKVLIWANVLTLLAAIAGIPLIAALALVFDGDSPALASLALAPAVALAAFARYAYVKQPEPDPEVWRLIIVLAIRWFELHIWAARFLFCFLIVGHPITWGGALALACITVITTTAAMFGNGIGVREWTVGLIAPILPAALAGAATAGVSEALAADLLHRAVEITIAIPFGVAGALWLAARRAQQQPPPESTTDPPATPPT